MSPFFIIIHLEFLLKCHTLKLWNMVVSLSLSRPTPAVVYIDLQQIEQPL